MKFTGALVGLTLVVAAVVTGRAGGTFVARHLDPEVVHRADAYAEAVLSGNAERMASFYLENGIEMAPNRTWAEGRSAIQTMHEQLCAGPMKLTGFSFTHLETSVVGDTAYDVGTYRTTMTVPGAPGPIQDAGKYVTILKRSGGEWRAAYAIYNSDNSPGNH